MFDVTYFGRYPTKIMQIGCYSSKRFIRIMMKSSNSVI